MSMCIIFVGFTSEKTWFGLMRMSMFIVVASKISKGCDFERQFCDDNVYRIMVDLVQV